MLKEIPLNLPIQLEYSLSLLEPGVYLEGLRAVEDVLKPPGSLLATDGGFGVVPTKCFWSR